MTVKEFSLRANVNQETVRRWIRDGKIIATGNHYDIPETEFERIVRRRNNKYIKDEIKKIKRKIKDKKKQIEKLENEITRLESLI